MFLGREPGGQCGAEEIMRRQPDVENRPMATRAGRGAHSTATPKVAQGREACRKAHT